MAKIVDRERRSGHACYLITYTLAHKFSDSLVMVRDAVNAAHREMHSGKGWKAIEKRSGWIGSVRAVEITYGENGWHYHIHEIAVFNGAKADLYHLRERWQQMVRKQGFDCDLMIGCHIKRAKKDLAEYIGKWGIVPELVASHAKNAAFGHIQPFEIIDMFCQREDRARYADLFYEYYLATRGLHQLHPSPKFRADMKVEDPKGDRDGIEPLLELNHEQWQLIRKRGWFADLLNHAEQGEGFLRVWLDEHLTEQKI
jgi:hypothetical protein